MGGSLQKITETTIALTPIQMGARVYLPTLGRFTSVDPIDGGTPNRYVYVLDPINNGDYSGRDAMSMTLQGSSPGLILQAAGTLIVAGATAVVAIATSPVTVPAALVIGGVGILVVATRTDTAKIVPKAAVIRKVNLQKCRTYTQAPGYPGVIYSSNQLRNNAINATVGLLHMGINPGGFGIVGTATTGTWKNPIFASTAGWAKYSIPYPASSFEIHYSLNDETCWYADVKAEDPFKY